MTRMHAEARTGRRTLLLAGALAGLAAACRGSQSGADTAPTADRFVTDLRIPPLAASTIDSDGARRFALALRDDGRSSFLPGTTTPTWGVNGDYLGPTVRVRVGERVRMAVASRLAERTTLHWHGMLLPARMDGGPHQPIEPGATWLPQWTVRQPAATLWYHPHAHGSTAMHVYRGLAGLLVVDDPNGPELPGRYGIDDIPLILQDRRFDPDGRFAEADVDDGTYGLLGDTILINGTVRPRLRLRDRTVRLRLLNAANARVFHPGFADGRPFQVVGTDAGLLDRPVTTTRVRMSPGERVEIVVSLAARERVVLDSRGPDHASDPERGHFPLLQLEVRPDAADPVALPDRLAVGSPQPYRAGPLRRFRLDALEINGRRGDPARIDEVVVAGAHETWEISNGRYAHSLHIHGAHFRLLDATGADAGLKDTVFVPPGATLRLAVRFGTDIDPATPYMYHCHLLRHEDGGMSGQFVVVAPGTENEVPRSLRGHHH
ncbi:multicopper oxidase family protein [Micromonospora sp. NBS 11-29]|uniref:multicopper oxidase family protein n=1 Tax=Micromonospora sp. NBS 11-29 TaxID=1960879 RepID=UPI001C38CA97|nr:multicopper oxidase domain-containing protein [Micromonospora sp. NBS 11-29]